MSPIRKALVVDDDDDVLRICKISLQTFSGWAVTVAQSADAAVGAARREAPDVILLDVMMPEGGGLSILGRLKACAATAGIPVVLMTAADKVGIDAYRERGAAGIISKPFEPAALPEQIARIVGSHAAPDPLTALRVDYAHRLPGRVRKVALALRACRRAPGDARLLDRARTLAHRLRGTAGSYGFPAVGAAAGRVEDAILRAAWDEADSALRDTEALAAAAIHPHIGEGGDA